MVGKKSGKALLREEGLERTDNNMGLTSWPQVSMINQKNYYTEYLKRDDQVLALRLPNEESRNRMIREAQDRDRALAHGGRNGINMPDADVDMDNAESEPETLGRKTIIIHPGSQNLRIGLASDALPKTVPMVIARKWKENESEEDHGEQRPRRVPREDDGNVEPERMFGEDFASMFTKMSADLKIRMRNNKRRVLPNSKELVANYNRRTPPEKISEHNDPLRIDWTELSPNPKAAPEYFTGEAALRIPDESKPRYKLFWPLRHGTHNEHDYASKTLLYEDISIIIEDAIKQIGVRKKEWRQYECVYVIPDLYERLYVTSALEMLLREFGLARVCFLQESLGATFGAGYSSACVVDVGAQKTSICCVEEGMCIENSRVNLKFGGADITETFIKMMLFDHFPYADINLKRRYDFIVAEELKQRFSTMNEADISVQLFDFHLRAPGQDTRKYAFKTYDEVILAPFGLFQPSIFDNSDKLRDRRKLFGPSCDLYDGSPNDPVSSAQLSILEAVGPSAEAISNGLSDHGTAETTNGGHLNSTPSRQQAPNLLSRLNDNLELTPRSSVAGSPAPEGTGTPQQGAAANLKIENGISARSRDNVLPVFPLHASVLTSISHASNAEDDRRTRDFLGGVMVIGGGGQIPGFCAFLEQKMRELNPAFAKEILVGTAPRELDPQVVIWKGASVFGKLKGTNDSWIGGMEYDRLGSRLLAYKCMWAW
ncbi:MAG: actin-like protein arp8 [Sclerophora amabilis]|nr:MAG: actin-like protein arp8 [Sclerophora amabilis]